MIKVIIFFMLFTLSVFAEDNYMKEDGTFDWESYLDYGVEREAYNDTNTLIQLFNHYDKVKDDPFSLSTLSNDIVSSIYNENNFFDYYGDVIYGDYDSDQFYNMYKILYDNIHKFDVDKKIQYGLEAFVNYKINEAKLFDTFFNVIVNEEKNKVIKIELTNFDNKTNGLTIKNNGRVVAGILGGRTDYEYTIDYNGKKNVKIKHVKFKVTYLDKPSIYGVYIDDDLQKYYTEVNAILIGENNYYMYASFMVSTTVQYVIFGNKYKVRDLNKHEDGIISVEIIK